MKKTPKGLVHGFGQKVKMWPRFYFSENKGKKCVGQYFENKKCLEDYENEKLEKKSKNWDFCIGVSPWFGSKM